MVLGPSIGSVGQSERILLPVVMPLTSAATLSQEFFDALAQVLLALDVGQDFVKAELERRGK